MSGGQNVVRSTSRAIGIALPLFCGPGAVAGEPEGELPHRLESVVRSVPKSRPMRAPPRIPAPNATAQAW